MPEPATPFGVIGLLRRMQADDSLEWSAADRIDLDETIQRIESRFFDRNGDDAEPDLAGITRRWVAMTVRARRLA